jgi:hypothetical protein
MKKRISLFCIAAVLFLMLPAVGQAQVVVAGNPPLTEETIGRFTEFFEWAFDVQLTNDQRQVLRQYTVDSWTQKRASDINDVVGLVQQQVEIAKYPAEQRHFVRVKLEPELLAQMRAQPNEPMAVWALAVYEASHRAIAYGNPPLTRQGTDAFLEALFFMAGEVSGKQTVPDQKLKDDWARVLAANYPAMSAEQKQQIAGMPLWAAMMRMAWPQLSAEVKGKYRTLWAGQLKDMLPAAAEAPAAANRYQPTVAANRAPAGRKSVEEMMAEQNRRHQRAMQTNDWMRNISTISYNTSANWSGNPWRYW